LAKIKILNPKQGIIIAFDRDESGINGAVKASQMIEAIGFDAFFAIPPINYDVNDWNDFKCKLRMSDDDISKVFESTVVRSSLSSRVELLRSLSK
jgi:phage/plasmid primase-like uncharacterized protein